MKKIMIALAPVSHEIKGSKLDPIEVAEEVIACAQAGASLVHLHVRDENGMPTCDLTHFNRTVARIRQESDIIIQGSTGGVSDLSLAERCISVTQPQVQMGSLNMGSANFGDGVYINTLPDIRFWAGEMEKYDVLPEFEIFELGMVHNVKLLQQEGFFQRPLNFQICMGFQGAMPVDMGMLTATVSALPQGAHWGLSVHGMEDFTLHCGAIALGADFIRVGYEDGALAAPNTPATNLELVHRARQLIELSGNQIADVDYCKKRLDIQK